MSNREEITKMVRGELTYKEAEELDNKLHNRSDREIINDLKELEFESLINTQEALEDYLDTLSELEENEKNRKSINDSKKALGYLHKAIKERCSELIAAEKKVKEILK